MEGDRMHRAAQPRVAEDLGNIEEAGVLGDT